MKIFSQIIGDVINLFYPRICAACGHFLFQQEHYICTRCLFHLPKTRFHLEAKNPIEMIFWGRAPIEHATSYYSFHKGSPFQKLIHKLKYQNQKEIGWVLGKHFGADLLSSPFFQKIDTVVPVPLHLKKERKRGYNQAEWIARGIAESMQKKLSVNNLYRAVHSDTQTRKSRFERWENVENVFKLRYPEKFINQHILLVDDVITTGSTLEACAHALLKVKGIKISVATLAHA